MHLVSALRKASPHISSDGDVVRRNHSEAEVLTCPGRYLLSWERVSFVSKPFSSVRPKGPQRVDAQKSVLPQLSVDDNNKKKKKKSNNNNNNNNNNKKKKKKKKNN